MAENTLGKNSRELLAFVVTWYTFLDTSQKAKVLPENDSRKIFCIPSENMYQFVVPVLVANNSNYLTGSECCFDQTKDPGL